MAPSLAKGPEEWDYSAPQGIASMKKHLTDPLLSTLAASALVAVCTSTLHAEDTPDAAVLFRARNRAAVEAEFAARQTRYSGNADALVRPGLLALRGEDGPRVEISAEATSIAKDAIVEFLLIGEGSGHDYEALFVSLATAKDIDAALKFLGMTPGRNAYAHPMDFWPKGERVQVTLKGGDGGADIPLENLVFDRRDGRAPGATLPATGFVYCGSRPAAPDPSRAEKDSLAADYDGPCSILSVYNEPTTLLDVPLKASQNEVYESFLANPAPGVKAGDLVTLVLTPEARGEGEGPRVTNHTLSIENADDVSAVLKKLSSMADRFDPFVTLDWGDTVTLGEAERLARQLEKAEEENGIRIEAPREGQPYYRAFLPDPAWRDRAKRPTQPLELRFSKDSAGALCATLISITEIWPEDGTSLTPELKTKDMAVPSAKALPQLVAETGNEIAALLVFGPASLTLGEALPYVRAVQKERPNVYFFVIQDND